MPIPDYVMDRIPAPLVGVLLGVLAVWWIVGTVVKLVKKLRAATKPFVNGVKRMLEDWQGVPADELRGHEAVPGVMERLKHNADAIDAVNAKVRESRVVLDEHTQAIADIRHQVGPNGGTSAHDAIMVSVGQLRELVSELMAEHAAFKASVANAISELHPGVDSSDFIELNREGEQQ